MYTGDLARERIQDLVRDADAYRRSKSTRVARASERRTRARRIAVAALSAVVWPVKH